MSDLFITGLGTTLLHSIWQGMVMVLLLKVVLYLVPKSNVQLKYWLSVTALTGLLFWTGYTFNQSMFVMKDSPASAPELVMVVSTQVSSMTFTHSSVLEMIKSFFDQQISLLMPYMDTMVMIWLLGVLFFLLRLQGSILYLRRIKTTGSQPVPPVWQQKAVHLSQRLGLHTPVKLLESRLAEVPMVIGHIKPVILIPMGMLTGLTVSEVEAILAHELAHVKRYDYLINIVQTVIESLLFFNPAVWWISQSIRKHREHCCDDIAVKCCGNQMVYASALSNLGAWSLRSPTLGMGLFKNKNELLMRIKRLVYPQVGNQTIKDKLVPGVILTLTVICLSWYSQQVQAQLNPAQSPRNAEMAPPPESPETVSQTDTIPRVAEDAEVLPPMVPDEIAEPEEFEFRVEVDTVFPGFDAMVEFGDIFVTPPDFDGFAYFADEFNGLNSVVVPDVFVSPDVWVDVQQYVDNDHLADVLSQVHIQFNDTTRERIMEALQEQRKALEKAMSEQQEALEKARQQLRKSLESGRPDDLTEEEWEMAKQKIEQAERSLERAMAQSNRELEQALEGHEYNIHWNMDQQLKEDMDRNRIVIRQVQRDRERIQHDVARAHRNADQVRYQWDTGNEAKLRRSMLKDGLIDEYDSDISLTFNKFGIKVNGVKLDGGIKQKYRQMLEDMYGKGSSGSLTFSR